MFTVHDCLSDCTVSDHESKLEADNECERLGGEKKCFYVFTSPVKCDKIKESVGERGIELSLF